MKTPEERSLTFRTSGLLYGDRSVIKMILCTDPSSTPAVYYGDGYVLGYMLYWSIYEGFKTTQEVREGRPVGLPWTSVDLVDHGRSIGSHFDFRATFLREIFTFHGILDLG